jgi:hypothetical protein
VLIDVARLLRDTPIWLSYTVSRTLVHSTSGIAGASLNAMVWGVGSRVPHRLSHLVGASSPHAHVRLGVRLQCHQPYHSHPGHISSPKPPSIAHPSSIAVGNGFVLPITSVGDSVLPESFYLNDVLVAPNLIESLLSVCHFTTNNSCSWSLIHLTCQLKTLLPSVCLPDTTAQVHSTSSYFNYPYPVCCPVRPSNRCFLSHLASSPWPPQL